MDSSEIVTLVDMFSYIEGHAMRMKLLCEMCRETRGLVHSGIKVNGKCSVLMFDNVQFIHVI